MCLALGILLMAFSPDHISAAQEVRRVVYQAAIKNEPAYLVITDFNFDSLNKDPQIVRTIQTIVTGSQVNEVNYCALSSTNRIVKIEQMTSNNYDQVAFDWAVDNSVSASAAVSYYDRIKNYHKNLNEEFPQDGYSIQAFMYWIQMYPINPKKVITYHLLVPPATFYPVVVTVQGTETLVTPVGSFICYRLLLQLQGFLGWILPSYTFWVQADVPHIPIKYQNTTFTYNLIDLI